MAAADKPRLDALTSVRFFAAFGVLVFHSAGAWLGPMLAAGPVFVKNLVLTGYVSVGFFFVLSGFVLAYTYGAASAVKLDVRKFWRARFARVYPVFLLGLLVGAIPAYRELHRELPAAEATMRFAWYGVANFFMVTYLVPGSGIWNYPGWSLAAEAVFYLCFPWIALAVWRLPKRSLVPACVVVGLVALAVPLAAFLLEPGLARVMADIGLPETPPGGGFSLGGFVKTHPLARIPDFILGVVLGRLFLDRLASRGDAAKPRVSHGVRALLATAAIIAVLAQADRIPYLLLHSGLLDLLFAAVIYSLAMDTGLAARVLGFAPLVLLGEASYALYILHVPVRDWLRGAIARSGLAGSVPPFEWFMVFAVATVLVSMAVFAFIEEPLRIRIRGRSR